MKLSGQDTTLRKKDRDALVAEGRNRIEAPVEDGAPPSVSVGAAEDAAFAGAPHSSPSPAPPVPADAAEDEFDELAVFDDLPEDFRPAAPVRPPVGEGMGVQHPQQAYPQQPSGNAAAPAPAEVQGARQAGIKISHGVQQADGGKDAGVESADDINIDNSAFWSELRYVVLKIVIILAAFLAIFLFVFGAFRTSDVSMSPMIKNGDLVVFFRLDKDFAPGDVAVLNYEGERTCARVVAQAGDTVDIKQGHLVVNGSAQREEDIFYETFQVEGAVTFPVKVQEGQIFLLGDNREVATDSRIYGCVNEADTEGTVAAVFRRRGF